MLQLLPIIGIWTRPATLIAPSHSLEAIPSTADTLYLVFSWITFAAVAEALKFPPFSTTNFTGWPLIGPNSFAAASEPLTNWLPIVAVEPVVSAMIPTVTGSVEDDTWAAEPPLLHPAVRSVATAIAVASVLPRPRPLPRGAAGSSGWLRCGMWSISITLSNLY